MDRNNLTEREMGAAFHDISSYIPMISRGMRIYYDCGLQKYNIGWSQQFLLEHIYNNPGVKPQELTDTYRVEKCTTTRGLKRLYDEGYIEIETDPADHRSKRLYPAKKADGVMDHIKYLRSRFDRILMHDISCPDLTQFETTLKKLHDNLAEEIKIQREGHAAGPGTSPVSGD